MGLPYYRPPPALQGVGKDPVWSIALEYCRCPLKNTSKPPLRSTDPLESLRSLALRLSAQGQGHAAILAKFEDAREQLREAGRESDEDAVMDAIDCLVGWCCSADANPARGEMSRGETAEM